MGQMFERSGGMPLKITHAELACEVGTTREVISRILKDFERQQCISLNRGQIHLVSQDGLEWFTNNNWKAG
jgi:CRP/FNR family transcriptional regulator